MLWQGRYAWIMRVVGITIELLEYGMLRRDPISTRVRKKVYNQTTGGTLISDTKFLYDGWNVIAELDGNDTLLQTYVWGLDLSGSYSGAGGVGGLLKIEDHGTEDEGHYVSYDGNGNVVALVSDYSGDFTARYEYGPFGEVIRATGAMAAKNPFQFSTKFVDLESGFYYYGMRYYNPTTGRWISRDPIGDRGGLNLYGFVGNDPVNHIDLLGAIDWRKAWAGLLALAGCKKLTSSDDELIGTVEKIIDGLQQGNDTRKERGGLPCADSSVFKVAVWKWKGCNSDSGDGADEAIDICKCLFEKTGSAAVLICKNKAIESYRSRCN